MCFMSSLSRRALASLSIFILLSDFRLAPVSDFDDVFFGGMIGFRMRLFKVG